MNVSSQPSWTRKSGTPTCLPGTTSRRLCAKTQVPFIPPTHCVTSNRLFRLTVHQPVPQSAPKTQSAEEKRLVWKQDLRIIPLSATIYLLCFLDRANIGNAKVLNSSRHHDMQQTTNMSNYQFTLALMVFLVAYAVFEVPSNILLKKLRPSRWLAFLMLSWGVMTMCLGATHSFGSVTAVRFLLGMFEAGLFPGLVYYLTFWYKHDERSVRCAYPSMYIIIP